jgi:hypothetical protein
MEHNEKLRSALNLLDELGETLYEKFRTDSYPERYILHDVKELIRNTIVAEEPQQVVKSVHPQFNTDALDKAASELADMAWREPLRGEESIRPPFSREELDKALAVVNALVKGEPHPDKGEPHPDKGEPQPLHTYRPSFSTEAWWEPQPDEEEPQPDKRSVVHRLSEEHPYSYRDIHRIADHGGLTDSQLEKVVMWAQRLDIGLSFMGELIKDIKK